MFQVPIPLGEIVLQSGEHHERWDVDIHGFWVFYLLLCLHVFFFSPFLLPYFFLLLLFLFFECPLLFSSLFLIYFLQHPQHPTGLCHITISELYKKLKHIHMKTLAELYIYNLKHKNTFYKCTNSYRIIIIKYACNTHMKNP
jgi:hypothetical protein